MGSHRFPRLFRIAMLDRLKNVFVMKLSAIRATRHLENAQPLLAQKPYDRIQQRQDQGIGRASASAK